MFTTATTQRAVNPSQPGGRRTTALALVALLIAAVLAGCRGQQSSSGPASASNPVVRIGWQPPWANQGQIVTVLKSTDLLATQGLTAEFVPFSYGGPMGEAALAGRIDVMLAGDQPILTLVTRSDDWKIVARMTSYRSAIVVPKGSSLQNLQDLVGKTIGTAFGSTTHRDLMRMLGDKSLTDRVRVVNIDQAEQAGVIAAGGDQQWGELAAIASYDPTVGMAVRQQQARILQAWASPALIAVRRDLVDSNPQAVRALLRSIAEAFVMYAHDPTVFDDRYVAESKLPLTADDFRQIAEFEPNMKAESVSQVDLRLTPEFIQQLETNAAVAVRLGIIKQQPDLRKVTVSGLTP